MGAAVGSGVISAGLGYAAMPVAGAVLAAAGLLLVFAGSAAQRDDALAATD
jgi:DHA1 family inner membrane transport protein